MISIFITFLVDLIIYDKRPGVVVKVKFIAMINFSYYIGCTEDSFLSTTQTARRH